MEVIVPVATSPDFHFDSTCSTPFISAPSSPKHFGNFYFSAPTSPTGASAFYHDFNNLSFIDRTNRASSSIPFDWEETPGTPKSCASNNTNLDKEEEDDDDFAFDFSGQFEKSSLSAADELFDGGKIKPLKPPPRLLLDGQKSFGSSPRSPIEKIKKAFSPKQKKEIDPFAIAMEESRKSRRERVSESEFSSSSKPTHRPTRSMSPFRAPWIEPEPEPEQQEQSNTKVKPIPSSSSSSKPSYRKWRLRDFLLFRSASEGRASDQTDQLRKYAAVTKKDDVKNSSFRSTDSSGSGSGSMRRGPLSAHELHYTTNRAVSEELKKKTYLPYKQGLFGCMGLNPAMKGLAGRFNM